MINKIIIDPGHGGTDPGAAHGNVYEKEINLKIATSIIMKLAAMGYNVFATRTSDDYVSLIQRVALQKQHECKLFISIHCDSFYLQSAREETVFHYYGSTEGQTLSEYILKRIAEIGELEVRGVKEANFYVLRETTCTAVLVECGFLSNPGDRLDLTTPEYQKATACAITLGINDYCKNRR